MNEEEVSISSILSLDKMLDKMLNQMLKGEIMNEFNSIAKNLPVNTENTMIIEEEINISSVLSIDEMMKKLKLIVESLPVRQ